MGMIKLGVLDGLTESIGARDDLKAIWWELECVVGCLRGIDEF